MKLRAQVLSLQETHVFSPHVVNTFRAGFSRAAFNYDALQFKDFPANFSFVTGEPLGGFIIGGGNTTTGLASITAAGSNNAANVLNRRNLFTYTDTVGMSLGRHQLSVGVWFQRMQDNEDSASRRLGQATFGSLTTFLQGTPSKFPGNSESNRNRLPQLVRSVVHRRYDSRSPQSYGGVGLAARIHHWLERSGWTRGQLDSGRKRHSDYEPPGGQFCVHYEQCDEVVRSTRESRVGSIWGWQDGCSRRLRDVLLIDRQSRVSAELDSALQRRRDYLRESVDVQLPAAYCRRAAAGRMRTRRAHAMLDVSRRRACNRTRRHPRCKTGIFPSNTS